MTALHCQAAFAAAAAALMGDLHCQAAAAAASAAALSKNPCTAKLLLLLPLLH
jgi:hypothetical protein